VQCWLAGDSMRAKDATIKAEAKPSKPARKASVAAPDVEAPLPPSSSPSPPPPPARRRPWWLKVLTFPVVPAVVGLSHSHARAATQVLVLLVLGALLYMYVEETQEAEQRAKQVGFCWEAGGRVVMSRRSLTTPVRVRLSAHPTWLAGDGVQSG
jgi:hypothetical protein